MKRYYCFTDLVGMCKNRPDVLAGLQREYNRDRGKFDRFTAIDPQTILEGGFSWFTTIEGRSFWHGIYRELSSAIAAQRRYI